MYLQESLASGLDSFEDSLQFRKCVMSAQEKTVIIPVCSQTANLSSACQRVIYDKFVRGAKYILNSGIYFALLNCRKIMQLLWANHTSCEKWDGGAGKAHRCKPKGTAWLQTRQNPSVFWQSLSWATPLACLLTCLTQHASATHANRYHYHFIHETYP